MIAGLSLSLSLSLSYSLPLSRLFQVPEDPDVLERQAHTVRVLLANGARTDAIVQPRSNGQMLVQEMTALHLASHRGESYHPCIALLSRRTDL